MENQWQVFTKELKNKLSNSFKLFELKTIKNKVISYEQLLRDNTLSYEDIGWIREKKDISRYKSLQKYHELLLKYDSDTIDDFEYAIYDVYSDEESKKEIEQLFEKLKNHIEIAQTIILKESKEYL